MLSRHHINVKYRAIPVQVKASFWFLVCTVLQRSISIITTPIYARLLSTYEYGQYSVFTSWKGILSCLVTLEICSGVYMSVIVKHENERDRYTSAIEGLTLLMSLAWMFFYFVLKNVWQDITGIDTPQMVAMFVIMWGNAVFGFWSTEQRVDYKYRALVGVTLAVAIVQPTLCVVFIKLFTNKVTGLVWGIAASNLMIYFALFIRHMFRGKVYFSGEVWKYTLVFAVPLVPHYISSIVLNSSDRIMIKQIIGEREAGIYGLAYTISICGTMINQAVLQTLSPWIFRKLKVNRFQDIPKVAYSLLVVIGLMNLAIVILLPEIIRIFAPVEYYDAIWVMPPISLAVFFMFMYNLFACFEFYYEKKSYVSTATMIGAGLNIFLNNIFIRRYGYIAAGYTTLFCYIMFAIMHYIFMDRICREKIDGGQTVYNPKMIISISLLYLLLGALIVLTYRNSYLRYSIIAIGVVTIIILRKKVMIYIAMILNLKRDKN